MASVEARSPALDFQVDFTLESYPFEINSNGFRFVVKQGRINTFVINSGDQEINLLSPELLPKNWEFVAVRIMSGASFNCGAEQAFENTACLLDETGCRILVADINTVAGDVVGEVLVDLLHARALEEHTISGRDEGGHGFNRILLLYSLAVKRRAEVLQALVSSADEAIELIRKPFDFEIAKV
ncbi:hypothetical protein KKD62_02240 [Patescibacteria group bacterium]|nr:hypothetical protein [Patescibacteria group bacterium]MBU1931689.1 hypothetical protein [Patescibacteria group bacterium]